MKMETTTPVQYSERGQLLKKFLHTKIGKRIGFALKLRGFNRVGTRIVRADGRIENLGYSYNDRVDKGADLCASLLAGEALNSIASPLAPKYIALSTATLTPAAGDTTLDTETAASGMARAVGTIQNYTAPASLDAACSYDIYKEFTATGSITIVSSGLFDASSTGNLFVEDNFTSSAVLENADKLQITWSVAL